MIEKVDFGPGTVLWDTTDTHGKHAVIDEKHPYHLAVSIFSSEEDYRHGRNASETRSFTYYVKAEAWAIEQLSSCSKENKT